MMKQKKNLLNEPYKYGFTTTIKTDFIKKEGLNSELIKALKIKNMEPDFISEFRGKALEEVTSMRQPDWSFFEAPDINYDNICYYSAVKNIDQEENKTVLEKTLDKLGLNIENQENFKNLAVDLVFNSTSIVTTVEPFLLKAGIIFKPFFKASFEYPKLVQRYLGKVVSLTDNFFAALNSIVFSEGSFCFIPKDLRSNFDLSTYFRTNFEDFAQFERTLLIVSENSEVNYLEGCTAPLYLESQLHVAVVELIAKPNSILRYSTIQNWYRGDCMGFGGLYNFTTKRGLCLNSAFIEWVQIEMGSSITWKYPSTLLVGDNSISEFYSISFISASQEADTGGKMIHFGANTRSKIFSKTITLNNAVNVYRGLVEFSPKAFNAFNYTNCDSLLIGSCGLTATIPYSKVIFNNSGIIQQEASVSKLDEEYLFFLNQRGIEISLALNLLVSGFCTTIYKKLPPEFSAEVPFLINLRMEDALG